MDALTQISEFKSTFYAVVVMLPFFYGGLCYLQASKANDLSRLQELTQKVSILETFKTCTPLFFCS